MLCKILFVSVSHSLLKGANVILTTLQGSCEHMSLSFCYFLVFLSAVV